MPTQERDRRGPGEGASSDVTDRFRLGPRSLEDPGRFAAIYKELYPNLQAHAMSLLRSPDRADDAIQSAFMSTIDVLKRGKRIEDIERWLHRCVHNACMNELRRNRPISDDALRTLPAADDPVDVAHWRSRCRQMYSAVDEMPEHVRTALLLSEVRGLSYREIAAEMKRSVESVRALIFRARSDLRATMGSKVKALLAPFAQVGELLERSARIALGPVLPVVAAAALAVVVAQPVLRVPAVQGPSSEPRALARVDSQSGDVSGGTETGVGERPSLPRVPGGDAGLDLPEPAEGTGDRAGANPGDNDERSGRSPAKPASGNDGTGGGTPDIPGGPGRFDYTMPPPVEAPVPDDPPAGTPEPPVEAPVPDPNTDAQQAPLPDANTNVQSAAAGPQGEPAAAEVEPVVPATPSAL